MEFESFAFEMALIFVGSSLLGTVFLYFRQPIILAYIFVGCAIGPWGIQLIKKPEHIEHISHIGIFLLMFLMGLNLHPKQLVRLLRSTLLVVFSTSLCFAGIGFLIALAFRFPLFDSFIVGLAMMFSSTVIGIKLIPTTTLHQRHMGDLMVSVLLLQDILAILVILFLYGSAETQILLTSASLIFKSIALFGFSWIVVKFAILPLFRRFDVVQDYLFLISLGWCFLAAALAKFLGLSYEIGAFVAGVALAVSPIAQVIAEGLKPVREFFLILFFFCIGANFNPRISPIILAAAAAIAAALLLAKPFLFTIAFRAIKEKDHIAKELSARLGQASEFSLLVSYSAIASGKISTDTSYLIQMTTILTFIVSTYYVVFKYPTPISVTKTLRKD